MCTQDWKSFYDARVLLIGHDPRLGRSRTIAKKCFFFDCFLDENNGKIKALPIGKSEQQKYGLAKVVFDQLEYLTNNRFKKEEIYVTNLCNDPLPSTEGKGVVYIPEEKAIKGIENIKHILKNNPSIKFIFPMSLQVNYWLQKLQFYSSENDFLHDSEPSVVFIKENPKIYKPRKQGAFKLICGNTYRLGESSIIIPILHPKNFPLKNNFIAYQENYNRIIEYFKKN
jgi:hypothetical protein